MAKYFHLPLYAVESKTLIILAEDNDSNGHYHIRDILVTDCFTSYLSASCQQTNAMPVNVLIYTSGERRRIGFKPKQADVPLKSHLAVVTIRTVQTSISHDAPLTYANICKPKTCIHSYYSTAQYA